MRRINPGVMRKFFERLFCYYSWQKVKCLRFGQHEVVCEKCGLKCIRIVDDYPL